jgi:hypothetical protein
VEVLDVDLKHSIFLDSVLDVIIDGMYNFMHRAGVLRARYELASLPTKSAPEILVGEGCVLPRERTVTLRHHRHDLMDETGVQLPPLQLEIVDLSIESDLYPQDVGLTDFIRARKFPGTTRTRRAGTALADWR